MTYSQVLSWRRGEGFRRICPPKFWHSLAGSYSIPSFGTHNHPRLLENAQIFKIILGADKTLNPAISLRSLYVYSLQKCHSGCTVCIVLVFSSEIRPLHTTASSILEILNFLWEVMGHSATPLSVTLQLWLWPQFLLTVLHITITCTVVHKF